MAIICRSLDACWRLMRQSSVRREGIAPLNNQRHVSAWRYWQGLPHQEICRTMRAADRPTFIGTEVNMDTHFLSTLEIRNLIERALLPDYCCCQCSDGRTLDLTLQKRDDPDQRISLTGIPLESLQSSRSIAELIGEARYLLMQRSKQRGRVSG